MSLPDPLALKLETSIFTNILHGNSWDVLNRSSMTSAVLETANYILFAVWKNRLDGYILQENVLTECSKEWFYRFICSKLERSDFLFDQSWRSVSLHTKCDLQNYSSDWIQIRRNLYGRGLLVLQSSRNCVWDIFHQLCGNIKAWGTEQEVEHAPPWQSG